METYNNRHHTPEKLTSYNQYDAVLLKQLNEEYRSKPYVKSFPIYNDASQEAIAARHVDRLSGLCDLTGKRILEIGCGGGYVCYEIARRYKCEIIGVDIYQSETWERFHHPGLQFVQADLSRENPFGNGFDLIISYVAWEHIRHPYRILRICANLLQLYGTMFISANLYRSPVASHLYRHIFFPWPHLLFEDRLLISYALDQGVEQWWIDAFYHVNKLTYAEYLHYFDRLGLHILHEKFSRARFDADFYNRFEDRLGLYPLWDLVTNFFEVYLIKERQTAKASEPIIREICMVVGGG